MGKPEEILKEARIKSGMSQLELAIVLGYSTSQFISNCERGLCSWPLNVIPKVCALLNVPSFKIKQAFLKDYEEYLDSKIKTQGR